MVLMRIVQLTPGTGNFICGSCVRDNTLVRALRRMGHDVTMVPLYLPHALDEEPAVDAPVFFGGINVYLQQKFPLAGYLPRPVQRLLDRPVLLRWLAGHAGMTRARDLGELTVSMIQGEHGHQHRELDKLIAYLHEHGRPDAISLSNAMLLGMARRLRRELGCPVVCTLAGEDTFLDALVEPYRTRAWSELQRRAGDADALVAVSRYYAGVMSQRLSIPAERVHVVHNGIDTEGFEPTTAPAGPQHPPAIGYLARLCETKGLATLVEAFILLRRCRPELGAVKLILAGSMTASDRPFVDQQLDRLRAAHLHDDVELLPNLDHAAKQRMLRRITALSVPATYGESFGLYLLEAWASGAAVVQPRHAAFPELLEPTGGGILVEPHDPAALAEALASLIADPDRAREVGRRGRQAVLDRFTADHMAAGVMQVLRTVTGTREQPAEVVDGF